MNVLLFSVSPLECGDLSPLSSVATWRDLVELRVPNQRGVEPPRAKAVTGYRTPNATMIVVFSLEEQLM
jgi:hypothetical protein